MPLRNSVSTLQNLSLKAIVDNFAELRFEIPELPYLFINKLYGNRDDFKYPLLATIFINPGTQKLQSLYEFGAHHIDWVVNRIQTLCQNLRHLDLTNQVDIQPEQLSTLVKHLPELQQIKLTGTYCNDDVVKSIGYNCQKLRNLDVSQCFSVSDFGISHLYGNSSIEVLHVIGTTVTVDCCLDVLDNLENLKEFSNTEWKSIFRIFEQRLNSHQIQRTYNIQVISDQNLMGPQLKANIFLFFPKLKRLCVGHDEYSYFFNADKSFLLKNAGLTSLRLISVKDLDFDVVGHLCPNLDELELSHCKVKGSNASFEGRTPLFPKLRVLKLQYTLADFVTLLLNAPNLQELSLIHSSCFIEEPLSRVLDSNGLRKLRDFKIATCKEITPPELMKLLMTKGPLSDLYISQYTGMFVDQELFETMNDYIVGENLNVHVHKSFEYFE